MTNTTAAGPAAAFGLALIAACGGFEYEGEIIPLDPAICSPDGEFTLEGDNPWFPLEVGRSWVLEGGDERVVITVLDETEVVAGVSTRVVEEREFEEGELEEVSRNYFARAADGTVCYFGEDVEMYEDGELVSRAGEWRADAEGSRPGILMPAKPVPGASFPMEISPGGAEDRGLIVAMGETVEVPAGTFTETVRMLEIDPLDDEREFKLFAAGVGPLVDEDIELVQY